MQQKQRPPAALWVALAVFIVLLALMMVDVAPSQHPIEKTLDAKTLFGAKQ